MCNVQLKDLKRLVKCENNKIILLLQAQVKKGYTNWQHPFNVEGVKPFFKTGQGFKSILRIGLTL
jgi:hypothetical protein